MTRRIILAVVASAFVGLGAATACADLRRGIWDSPPIDRYHYGCHDAWDRMPYHEKYHYRGSAILRAPVPLGPRVIVPFPGHPAVVLPPARIYGYPSLYGPGYLSHPGYRSSGTTLHFSFGW
jgi:hypothetical protein